MTSESMQTEDDFRRELIENRFGRHFRDRDDLDTISEISNSFEGNTCPEMESRFLKLLSYARMSSEEMSTATQGIITDIQVTPDRIEVTGRPGVDAPEIAEGEPVEQIKRTLLQLFTQSPLRGIDGQALPTQAVLAKNPYSRMSGAVFAQIYDNGWRSPLVVGVQNGLVMLDNKLWAVEGAKEDQGYTWQVKRPIFTSSDYDMAAFKSALLNQNLLELSYSNK